MLKKANSQSTYEMVARRKIFFIAVLLVLLIAIALAAISAGSAGISFIDILKTLVGKGTKKAEIVVYGIRLPRIYTAVLVGATLAIAGAVMQSILRNQLASASTLGVSQGAAFGATIAIILFGAGTQNSTAAANAVSIDNPYVVTICAFMGGAISAVVVLILSRIKRIGPEALVLSGVALSAMFSGGTTLMQYFAEDVQVAAVVFWTFGDLGRTNGKELIILLIVFIIAFIYFMFNRWNYNALNSGHHTAKSLGVNVESLILCSMIIASLASAAAVALVGIISFIGLVAPHLLRMFIGNDYRFLLPASAVAGAVLLLLADTFARVVISPIILPIGAITSFIGGPMFLYLLFKGESKHDRN